MTLARLPLSDFAPPEELWRVLYVMYDVGGALSDPVPRYEVRHGCGAWTRAEGSFCSSCGDKIRLPDEVLAEIVPAATVLVGPMASGEPGSFNNPHLPHLALPGATSGFNDDARVIEAFRHVRERFRDFLPPAPRGLLTPPEK